MFHCLMALSFVFIVDNAVFIFTSCSIQITAIKSNWLSPQPCLFLMKFWDGTHTQLGHGSHSHALA